MNKILSQQRKWLSFIFLVEILGLVALFLVSLFLPDFPYYFYIALGFIGFYIFVDTVFIILFNMLLRHKKAQTELKAATIIGNDINQAYSFGQLGLAVCDHKNNVIWVNDFMSERFNDIVDTNIFARFPKLERLRDAARETSKEHPTITFENKTYEVDLIR